MDVELSRVLESLILPPGGPLLLLAAGLLLIRGRPRLGRILGIVGAVLLWLASLPVVGYTLMHALEIYPPLDAHALRRAGAQAVVVLGAGRYLDAPEYSGTDTVSRWGMERLRYAAYAHRVTGLPILVSGGSPTPGRIPEARFMSDYLQRELGAKTVWNEELSRTTAENAAYSAALLRARGVRRILLVTHAWHEPRAVESFRRAGMEVIPAPTAFTQSLNPRHPWLPRSDALDQTSRALHEWVGRAVYALKAD